MRLALALVIALVLAACATPPPPQNPAVLKQSHGYVVAAVPLEFGTPPAFVTLVNLKTGEEVVLQHLSSDPAVLGLWAPSGTYEIEAMVGRDKGSYTPIDVVAGKVTDLGGLVWVGIGDRQQVLLPLRHPEISNRLAAALKAVDGDVSPDRIEWRPTTPPKAQRVPTAYDNTPLGLIPALIVEHIEEVNKIPLKSQLRSSKDLETFTRLALSAPAPLLGVPSFDSDGVLYTGSNFGRLRTRDSSGNWQSVDTGTLSPLAAVEAHGPRILVGTLDGHLLSSTDHAKTWKLLHKFDDSEAILGIDHVRKQDFVLTARIPGDKNSPYANFNALNVYVLDSASDEAPRLLRKIPATASMVAASMFMPLGVSTDNYYFVNALESVERLDLSTQNWKSVGPSHKVMYLRPSLDGTMLTAFKAQGGFSKLSVSSDFGESWSPMETPSYPVSDIRMASVSAGSAVRVELGAFSSAMQLVQYNPALQTWKPTWTGPSAGCARVIHGFNDELQFCITTGGSILRIDGSRLVPEFVAD